MSGHFPDPSVPMRTLTLLGATGSIGRSTLEVVALHPERYRVFALSAHRNVKLLAQQCARFQARYAVVSHWQEADQLQQLLRQQAPASTTEVLVGAEALCTVAAHAQVDVVMAAIVGAAGLPSTLAAAQAGKRILLANKEALVMSGALMMHTVHQHGATLLPVDSEHNAVFQSLPPAPGQLRSKGVARIILTASGGPFLHSPLSSLAQVTPQQACKHPNWSMGQKISVDSATMMNKGLELIEACWLFDARPEQVDILIHPQSIIHSLVSYVDGSVIAQLGNPDMRTPIAHALAWPERIEAGVAPLDLAAVASLQFQRLDMDRFPAVRLAIQAMTRGGTSPAILNAANEMAVEAFLQGRLRFDQIALLNERVLAQLPPTSADSLQQILAADALARQEAAVQMARMKAA